jgi:hypothetical protein
MHHTLGVHGCAFSLLGTFSTFTFSFILPDRAPWFLCPCRTHHGAQAELLRWCRVWQYTIYQLLTRGKTLHPDVAGLLDPEELAYYETAPKGRHLVVTRLRQLIAMACLEDGPVRKCGGGVAAHRPKQCRWLFLLACCTCA